jgi:hypothetical protein
VGGTGALDSNRQQTDGGYLPSGISKFLRFQGGQGQEQKPEFNQKMSTNVVLRLLEIRG